MPAVHVVNPPLAIRGGFQLCHPEDLLIGGRIWVVHRATVW